jgi:hypothetical protein
MPQTSPGSAVRRKKRPSVVETAAARPRASGTAFVQTTARVLLAPAFGAGMAMAFAAGWIGLGRDFTARAFSAALTIAVAAALAALLALIAARLLAQKPWSARYAAALILLVAGSGGLASLFIGMEMAWATHPMTELPLHIAFLVLLIISTGALYGFLAIAAPLILPLGLPLIAAFAALIAHRPR